MSAWLLRAVSWAAPADWRDAIGRDLEEEAGARGFGVLWRAWQIVCVGLKLRWTSGGSAMLFDLRYAVRSLLTARWFTIGAIATFALGIGVNVAVFSAVDRMLFRTLPYGEPGELILLRDCNRTTNECAAGSFPMTIAAHLAEQSSTMIDVAVAGFGATYRTADAGEDDPGMTLIGVTPNVLQTLRVQPAIGRDIARDEATSRVSVAWLSHEAWMGRWGGDPSVIGQALHAGSARATILGVLPAGFIPPSWASPTPEWSGLVVNYDNWSTLDPAGTASGRVIAPFARLKPGLSVHAAQAELDALALTLRADIAARDGTMPYLRVHALQASLFSFFQRYLWLLVAAAGLLLLLACANLASLFVARGRSRVQATAVCSALGASRMRLAGTACIEALVVCLAGTVAALVALRLATGILTPLLPPILARYWAGAFDARVLVLALGVTAATAMIIGIVSTWRGARVDLVAVLQQGRRDGGRLRAGARGLLATEACLGAVIVLAGALATQSFFTMSSEDLGFAPDRLHVVSVGARTPLKPPQQLDLIASAIPVLRDMPGVRSVATSDYGPARNDAPARGFKFPDGQRGILVQVSDGYFDALSTPILAGRPFTAADVSGRSLFVVLGQGAVQRTWPGEGLSAVLGRIWHGDPAAPREVIGVVPDLKFEYGSGELTPAAYVPMGSAPTRWAYLVVRQDNEQPFDLVLARDKARAAIGDVRVTARSVTTWMASDLQDSRFRAVLLSSFALVALIVASVGLYAVVSYDVSQRRYEMGVRLALGATSGNITRHILGAAVLPVVAGAIAGLVAALWIAGLAESFLYQTSPRDPMTYLLVFVVLAVSGVLAAWFPARRAARTDPAIVLRST